MVYVRVPNLCISNILGWLDLLSNYEVYINYRVSLISFPQKDCAQMTRKSWVGKKIEDFKYNKKC